MNHKSYKVFSVAFLAIVAVVVGVVLAYGHFNRAEAKPLPDSFAPLVERLAPAVVNISTTQMVESKGGFGNFSFEVPPGSPLEGLPDLFEHYFNAPPGGNGEGSKRKAVSLGSGFIIDPSGIIVTNNHVIEEADEISIVFNQDVKTEGKNVPAKVIGRDTKTDLALLKVEVDQPLPALKFGNSDKVKVGDWVLAIGNPFGLGGSVSAGIISARARDINAGPFDDFLQTDAAINRGNSGGPLFNVRGEVIGVNTAIFSPSGGNVGIGFALPSTLAKPVIAQLKEHGRTFRGWLGVKIQTLSEEIAESVGLEQAEGALVVEVTDGSPAQDAGIKVGDVILYFNKKKVETMRKLPRMVADTKAGSDVPVSVWRDGKMKLLNVKIGELPEGDDEVTKEDESEGEEKGKKDEGEIILGMTLSPLDRTLRNRYGIDKEVNGLVVLRVDRSSPAFEKGLRRRDVIVSVNQQPVESIKAFKEQVEKAKKQKRKSVLLLIDHNGSTQFVALPLEG